MAQDATEGRAGRCGPSREVTGAAGPGGSVPTNTALGRWGAAVVVVVAVVLYVRTVGFGFYQDDYYLVRHWTWSELGRAFTGSFDTTGGNDPYFRPLASVSFAAEWGLWGTSKWGYHVTNLLLHVGAGLAVLALLRRVVVPAWSAVVGAVFFVAIPTNATTVLYIAERTDAMVAICAMGALVLVHRYHGTRRTSTLVWINVVFLVGMLAKEVGVGILPMAASYWWYLRIEALCPSKGREGLGQHWAGEARAARRALVERAGRRSWLALCGPMVAVLAGYMVWRSIALTTGSLSGRFGEGLNPVRALVEGVGNTIKAVPWEVEPRAYVAFLAAVVLAFLLQPRSPTWRVFLLGVALVVSGVLPLTFNGGVDPRLMYLAETGFAVTVAAVAVVLVQAFAARGRTRVVALLGGAVLGVGFVGATAVELVRAQDVFDDRTDKMLDGAQRVFESPLTYPFIPPEHQQEIARNLAAAGRPVRPGG